MYDIIFKDVIKAYNKEPIIKGLNLTIKDGERFILLGPSGCGKTTTLRMIAGLETITGGTLTMGDRIVNDIAPGDRNIAMVFQNYALFPHLSVWENITFGLKLHKVDPKDIERRTNDALELLHLTDYKDHKPKELSGGQKQGVALCRALVKQSPYFLLDEPLSNLDAKLRQQARTELVKLHERYQSTMVYVTHDQLEAMTIANRVAVLKDGALQQVDTPAAVYHRPRNTFVAEFIGTPPMNLISTTVTSAGLLIGPDTVQLPENFRKQLAGREHIILGIRPENCLLADQQPALWATLDVVEDLGNQKIFHIKLPNGQVIYTAAREDQPEGFSGINFDWNQVNFFDPDTGLNLAYEEV